MEALLPVYDGKGQVIAYERKAVSNLTHTYSTRLPHRSAAPTDQLLNGEAFRTLLASMRKNFDVVIIDSPPVLPVVDARYLASHADVIVHVVRYGETAQGEVREASVQLREHLSSGVSYFGVLNLEERSVTSYYGGYSYYGDDRT